MPITFFPAHRLPRLFVPGHVCSEWECAQAGDIGPFTLVWVFQKTIRRCHACGNKLLLVSR